MKSENKEYLENKLTPQLEEQTEQIRELEKIISKLEPKQCDICQFSKEDKTCKAQTVGYEGEVIMSERNETAKLAGELAGDPQARINTLDKINEDLIRRIKELEELLFRQANKELTKEDYAICYDIMQKLKKG